MALTAGTRLSHYTIIGAIGAGGMGEVYRAHDARLGRDVAIKVLPSSVAGDPAALARFEREARAIGALNHPNVVNVFDTGTEDGVSYVVMEMLEGESLRAKLRVDDRPAALPKKKALEIAQQIAQGLAAAHARGIVHRDLKPDNVLVTHDGRVKILDFGLARAVPEALQQSGDAQTRLSPQVTAVPDSVPGLVLGTVGYMAPEQVRGQAVDHRADIFAFGCVLFEMLTGRRAFDGESPIETMGAILKTDPLEQPDAAVAIGGPLDPLLRHCLEKQPDERFQSARDLAFQLQGIASGSISTTSAQRAVAGARGRRFVLPAAIVASIAVGGLAGYWLSRSGGRTLHVGIPMPPDITMYPGISPARSGGVAVSSDGRWIAFVAGTRNRPQQIYVRSLESPDARPVPGTEGASLPAWSPDGTRLAFVKDRKLQIAGADGGSPRAIADMGNPRSAPSWGEDDTILFHADYRMALMRVPAAGGTPTEVVPAAPASVSWFSPVWIPGGSRFLVVRFHYSEAEPKAAGIYLGSLDSKEPAQLVSGPISEVAVGDGELFYRRGLELVAHTFDPRSATLSGEPRVLTNHVSMVSARGGTLAYFDPPGALSQGHRVTILSRAGDVVSQIGDAGTFRDPRFSPDGRHLAVARAGETGLFSIWSYDIVRNIDTRVSGEGFVSPAWTPDGRRIFAGGPAALVRLDPSGSAPPETFRNLQEYANPIDTTPDGKDVILAMSAQMKLQYGALAIDGKSEPRPIGPSEPIGPQQAAIAPNGQWIAIASFEGTNRRLSVRPYDGPGPRVPVTAGQAAFPRWRADGRELFFLDNVDGGLGPDPRVFAVSVTWTPAGPEFGTPARLFTLLRPILANHTYDVSADGQRFVAVLQGDRDPWPLTVRVRVPR